MAKQRSLLNAHLLLQTKRIVLVNNRIASIARKMQAQIQLKQAVTMLHNGSRIGSTVLLLRSISDNLTEEEKYI